MCVLQVDEMEGVQKLDIEASLPPPRGLYFEYNEMAIQLGYVTMFAAAAPWAATLCMLNNTYERSGDALAMLYQRQRPRYQGADGIGAWAMIFEFISLASIVTNIGMLGITSRSLRTMYSMSDSEVPIACL